MATFETISAAAIGGGGAGSSYLVYVVGVTQTGSGNLTVVNEYQNTIGTITITRQGVGYFYITSDNLFTENKTWIPNSDGNGYACYPISSSAANAEFYAMTYIGAGIIDIQFYDSTYNNVEPSSLLGDGFLLMLPEIRVYP